MVGTSDLALSFFLNQHKEVKELVFCLDNDAPGREASGRLEKKYADKGYSTSASAPTGKDYNEDLAALLAQTSIARHNEKNELLFMADSA